LTVRLFLAVDLADREKGDLYRLQQRLRPHLEGVRWVPPENMHLTLKFLGETDPALLPGIAAALKRTAASVAGYGYRLKGLGVFPNLSRPRVIWAGLQEGRLETEALFSRLEEELAPLGVAREGRQYFPHLSLGRIGCLLSSNNLALLLDREKGFATGLGRVDKILLYRSYLSGQGAKYESLREEYLSGDAGE